jgi:hypothetical protein
MFRVGDHVGYLSEEYDQDEVGIIQEVISENNDSNMGFLDFDSESDEDDVCYAVHWQVADFSVTIHHSMLKLK